jgi:hypothetical protein
VLESFKDLDDWSDDDNDSEAPKMDSSPSGEAEAPALPAPAPAPAPDNTGMALVARALRQHEVAAPRFHPIGSPIRMCTDSLLLAVMSFLGPQARAYVSLRLVCKAWLPLAEHDSLWKPLAQAYCRPASTSSSSSTSATPQRPPGSARPAPSPSPATPAADAPMRWVCRACGLIQVWTALR